MAAHSKRIKRSIAFTLIAAIWSALLGLMAIFALAYAVYSDLKNPQRSKLVAGTMAEAMAAGICGGHFSPLWQGDANCAQFDAELVYVPRPGRARFRAPEYDSQITIAADGTRLPGPAVDDSRPPLVLAGDSFTLGWGVNDAETFAAVLRRRYQRPSINAGVPSYGTARELHWLRRLGLLKSASTIVIQYCSNDRRENREFLRAPQEFFAKRDARRSWEELQRFGTVEPLTYLRVLGATTAELRTKVSLGSVRQFLGESSRSGELERQHRDSPAESAEMAADFLAVLDHFPELATKRVIVVEMNGFGHETGFLIQVEKLARQGTNVKVLRLQFQPGDFFRFDGHLTPRGHEAVAAQLHRVVDEVMREQAGR